MTGRFIISFDCEGKWGMADHLSQHDKRLLDDDSLPKAYKRLVATLASFGIPATFAFVLAFVMSEDERRELAGLLRPYSPQDEWMFGALGAQQASPGGWFCPSTLDVVRDAGFHEVACHGFSHRSFADGVTSPEDADRELAAVEEIARRRNVTMRTMVFPRNRIGNLTALQNRGYLGYRLRAPSVRRLPSTLASLTAELNLFPKPEIAMAPARGHLVQIPHGYFFNWRNGKRRLIPPAITVRRWKSLLNAAAAQGEVAHLWLHPHNFITGPGTWNPFTAVLGHAAKLREAGRLEILTQADYCERLIGAAVPEVRESSLRP